MISKGSVSVFPSMALLLYVTKAKSPFDVHCLVQFADPKHSECEKTSLPGIF